MDSQGWSIEDSVDSRIASRSVRRCENHKVQRWVLMAHSSATWHPAAQGSFSPQQALCRDLPPEALGRKSMLSRLSPPSSRRTSLSKLFKVTLPLSPRTVGPVLARKLSVVSSVCSVVDTGFGKL